MKFLAVTISRKLFFIFLINSIITITISGILKKLFNGETLVIFFKTIKIKDNFELADQFYNIHIYSNYTIIALIAFHIMAVIIHKILYLDSLIFNF